MKWLLSLLLLGSLPVNAQVSVAQASDRITINIDGKPFTDFFIGAGTTKPYLHPLRSASGKIVTRRFPMELAEGETRDHPHHRGLWFAHGDVNGIDYWGSDPTLKGPQAKIRVNQVTDVRSGKKEGSVRVTFDWLDKEGRPLLFEDRTMTFSNQQPALRVIDFDATLTAKQKATFGDTKEGTFAIRVAPQLEMPQPDSPKTPKRTGEIVSSEGRRGDDVWGTRANWVQYTGEIDGEKLGIVIMDYPSNPKHPTYWHARGYGLFAANIFGLREFLHDKSQDGSLTLEPGQALRFRYRVIIHPVPVPGGATIAEMYAKYEKTK